MRLFVFLSILCCCFACSSDTTSNTNTKFDNEHQNAINRLDSIISSANPDLIYCMNSERAKKLEEKIQNTSGKKFKLRVRLAHEYLKAGKTQKAIQLLENIKTAIEQQLPDNPINKNTKQVYDLLAVAYMRSAEEENCLKHHVPESCIFPFEKAAIHGNKKGSQQAIKIYDQLLNKFPNDAQSEWLLNIAHLTTGGNPPNTIIQQAKQSLNAFPKFNEVATYANVHERGLSGGVCMEDFNNDGLLDIICSSYGLRDPLRFYINNGDGSFDEISKSAGIEQITGGLNIIHADYNNDGYEDVFVLRGAWFGQGGLHPNSLLKNNRDLTFSDVTESSGLLDFHPSQTASWADINNDGWLDLFIGNETSDDNFEHPSKLMLNNKDGSFTNISKSAGVEVFTYAKSCTWGDINNDGLPELFISNLNGENYLFLNQSDLSTNKIKFRNIALQAGTLQPKFSFPSWFWDYNNDGWLDLFVSGYDLRKLKLVAFEELSALEGKAIQSTLPALFLNQKNVSFKNVAESTGLNHPLFTMGSNYGDINNDGFQDFYAGTGAPDFRSIVPNRMYLNNEGSDFTDITYSGGFGHIQKGHGVAFGDIDRDGDQDIYAVMGGAFEADVFFNALFQNPGEEHFKDHKWLNLKLSGTTANRSAIGARIKVTVEDKNGAKRAIYTHVSTGGSFGSSPLEQHIGLGAAKRILNCEIIWPDKANSTELFDSLELNQSYHIKQGAKEAVKRSYTSFSLKTK